MKVVKTLGWFVAVCVLLGWCLDLKTVFPSGDMMWMLYGNIWEYHIDNYSLIHHNLRKISPCDGKSHIGRWASPILPFTECIIHPASRGVAAHTAGLFRSVRGAKGGFPPWGLPKLRIFTFPPPPWGLPKLGNFHFSPPWGQNFHFSPLWGLPKLGNFHFSPPWGLPKLGNVHFSPPWGLPKLGNFHFSPPWGLPKLGNFHFSPPWQLPKLWNFHFSLPWRLSKLRNFK